MTSKLTIVLSSGLANQLFMLFTGISKAIDENREFNVYPIYNNFPRGYYFTSLYKSLIFKVENNINNLHNKPGYEEQVSHYVPIPKDVGVIKGYFQSPKYFNHNKYRIIKTLELDKFMDKYKLDYKAIAIHLRFGDMAFNQGNHVILKPCYYINAINKLINIGVPIDEYKILIFSEKDDDELVNDYISKFNETFNDTIKFNKFYDIHPNMKDYQELMYMSSCHHFIIANSTFSWFGAYLSNNNEKKVIYPNEWFGPQLKSQKSVKDLFPNEWIQVNSE